MTTNAHRRDHNVQNPVMGNKGYKYKHIIAPLISNHRTGGKKGTGVASVLSVMTLNNKIDYVHWDDFNEFVDRLLDAACRASNNAHDNKILSIIEELREAGLIIN